jgi:hypothetical protein
MHLCFATPWGTSWKPLCYVFLYARNTHLTFNALLLIIFRLCYFSCYNMVAKFLLSRLCLSCPCLEYFNLSTQCFTTLIKIVLVHVTSKIIVCYHLPTRGQAGVKLGDAWYVSNVSIIFDAPCLFIHHLLCVLLHFVAFLCIFQN